MSNDDDDDDDDGDDDDNNDDAGRTRWLIGELVSCCNGVTASATVAAACLSSTSESATEKQ